MRKMEHIMESVVVRIADVVRKRFTDEYIIPLQITLPVFSLRNSNLGKIAALASLARNDREGGLVMGRLVFGSDDLLITSWPNALP